MPNAFRSSDRRPLEVLVVGGGVAAAEAAIAVHELAGDRVALTLVSPAEHLVQPAYSVALPFEARRAGRHRLADLAETCGARLVKGSIAWVAPSAHTAYTETGDGLRYDSLVVATGARRVPAFAQALTFRGYKDVARLRSVVDGVASGTIHGVAFVVPTGESWTLPIYELALMTAARADDAGRGGIGLTVVTPEREPLEIFGGAVSTEIGSLLDAAGIACETDARPDVPAAGLVRLGPGGRTLSCDSVVALPRLRGAAVRGLPADANGFLRTSSFGHVIGVRDVYAAGDVTSFPIKQGGVACQQADVVAEAIAHRAGAGVTPTGYRPTLRGMLLTGSRPRWLRAEPAGRGNGGGRADISDHVLWWPPTKIAGKYLAPYLGASEPAGDRSPVKGRAVISRGRDGGEVELVALGHGDTVLHD